MISRAAFAVVAVAAVGLQAPQPPSSPAKPPSAAATSAPTDASRVYEAFRAWFASQPKSIQESGDVMDRYRAKLAADGLAPPAIDAAIKTITEHGDALEIDRWNRILTSPTAHFNREPNAFLVDMVKGRTAGAALDVGMGQGRNTLFLANQGWRVTGFDPAAQAVAAARAEADRLGLAITTTTDRDDTFDWGRDRWDLIVMSYVDVRGNAARAMDALKPGGIVVVEGFHRDAAKEHPIGGAVVFDTNELLTIFRPLRVLRYEDVSAVGDFGLEPTRVVRLCAEKP